MVKQFTITFILLVLIIFSFGQTTVNGNSNDFMQYAKDWYFVHILLSGPDQFATQQMFAEEISISTNFNISSQNDYNKYNTKVLRKETLNDKLNSQENLKSIEQFKRFNYYNAYGGNKGLKKVPMFDLSGLGGTF